MLKVELTTIATRILAFWSMNRQCAYDIIKKGKGTFNKIFQNCFTEPGAKNVNGSLEQYLT